MPDNKLVNLVKEIPHNYDIVIINDGSPDNYQAIFDEVKPYAHVISYKTNMGKGHALKEGFKYIKNNYQDYIIVTVDADGQHTIKDAEKLRNYVENHRDTLVIGKRLRSNKMPLRSRLGNGITAFIFRLKTGHKIYDTQSGLRAFSHELIDYMLATDGDRYEYEMNVLLNLKDNKIKCHEIPIKTIYIDNNKSSHFDSFKDSYKIMSAISKKTK